MIALTLISVFLALSVGDELSPIFDPYDSQAFNTIIQVDFNLTKSNLIKSFEETTTNITLEEEVCSNVGQIVGEIEHLTNEFGCQLDDTTVADYASVRVHFIIPQFLVKHSGGQLESSSLNHMIAEKLDKYGYKVLNSDVLHWGIDVTPVRLDGQIGPSDFMEVDKNGNLHIDAQEKKEFVKAACNQTITRLTYQDQIPSADVTGCWTSIISENDGDMVIQYIVFSPDFMKEHNDMENSSNLKTYLTKLLEAGRSGHPTNFFDIHDIKYENFNA